MGSYKSNYYTIMITAAPVLMKYGITLYPNIPIYVKL